MKKRGIYFLFGILFLISFTFVSAAPQVTTVQNFPNGYVIVEAQQPILKLGQNHTYYFFLYNASNGKLINDTDVNCKFYMANSLGDLLVEEDMILNPSGFWYLLIGGGNLSNVGSYSYGVNCQNDFGGSLAGTLEVTITGEEIEQNETIMIFGLIGLIGLFVILGFAFKEKWKVRSFFFMMSTLMGVILLNSLRIIVSSSTNLNKMMEISLYIGIIVLLFSFLYLFIYALIEVFHYFKKRDLRRWEVSDNA